MKIIEYKKITSDLESEFENVITNEDLLSLLDRIEFRYTMQTIYQNAGLNDNDEVPEPVNRIVFPSFKIEE